MTIEEAQNLQIGDEIFIQTESNRKNRIIRDFKLSGNSLSWNEVGEYEYCKDPNFAYEFGISGIQLVKKKLKSREELIKTIFEI